MADKSYNLPIRRGDYIPASQKLILGVQHTFTMFGATVLVPILTGLDISVTLFCAGIGTLLFHLITQRKLPVFLGSSFAYITPIALVIKEYGGIPAAQGGIIIAGLMYLILAFLIYFIGPKVIHSLFPPVVTGPIIMVIGLNLAPVAIDNAEKGWLIAGIAFFAAAFTSVYVKGFFRLIPVLIGIIAGYVASLAAGIIDFTPIVEAKWLGVPNFTLPVFSKEAVFLVAPVAIVTMVEHIGDVLAVSATVEEDFMLDPGLHRTLIGDGLATSLAGILGGPPNTTYSENTGVLALTKVWEPSIMRLAAVFAIALSLVGKLGGFIATIPAPVIGGISILLFGMIASIGVRTVVENAVDLKKSRNLIISSVILVLGIGGAVFELGAGVKFAGMGLAAITGMILNLLLPKDL